MNLYEEADLSCKSFWFYTKDIDLFIVDETNNFYSLNLFGLSTAINKPINVNKVFVYCDGDYIKIALNERFEYNLFTSMNLVEVYNHEQWDFPKEKKEMFSNFKITDVEFGEVSDVALESAVEKIVDDLNGVEIKTKGDDTFLVKNGTAIKLQGDEFKKLVEDYVIGKTVNGLSRNPEMFSLIKNLGIIKRVTLENKGGDLSSIFG